LALGQRKRSIVGPCFSWHARVNDLPVGYRFSAGTLGPVMFGLNLRDSCLVILFFNLILTIPPAYLYGSLHLLELVSLTSSNFPVKQVNVGSPAWTASAMYFSIQLWVRFLIRFPETNASA